MQYADKPVLEKQLDKLTDDSMENNEQRSLIFDNPPYYASVKVDKNNQVIEVSVGYTDETSNLKYITGRNIGSKSSFSDVLKVYGDNYHKKTYRNLMDSGDGYFITYMDKEHNTAIQFEFNKGVPNSDRKVEVLTNIKLYKLLD